MTNFKVGTEIEVRGFSLTGAEVWYPAKIGRVARKSDKLEGWHPITYPDGAKLMCHESGFRALAPAGYFQSAAFKASDRGYETRDGATAARELQAHPGNWHVWQMNDGRWHISLMTNREV